MVNVPNLPSVKSTGVGIYGACNPSVPHIQANPRRFSRQILDALMDLMDPHMNSGDIQKFKRLKAFMCQVPKTMARVMQEKLFRRQKKLSEALNDEKFGRGRGTNTRTALNLQFLENLTSHYSFYSSTINIITCKEYETINLIKMLSSRFQRLVVVHSTDNPLQPFSYEPQIFLLDLRCPKAEAVLQRAEHLMLFGKPFQWLILNDNASKVDGNKGNSSENGENWFWPFVETLNILTDSDVKVAEQISDDRFTVTGVYKIGRNFIREPLAEWSSRDGIVFKNTKSVAHRRWNLQGVTMPSSLVVTDPNSLLHLDDLVDKHIDTTSKVSYNVVNLFADLFNASIKYKIDKEWGIPVNGSWTGMVGDLEKKEIEFGAAPLFMQKSRLHIVEYCAMVNPSRVKFIFLSPPLSYANNIYLIPFDYLVWGCCLTMVAVCCFALFIALKYEKNHLGIEMEDKLKVSFTEILILNIGAICLQGTYAQTKNPPSRIITLFLYLAYMFLYISYSAAIVAILQSSDTSIQTLADFLKSPLKGGADDIAYSQYYFKTVDDELRKAIYQTKIAPKGEAPHFLPVDKGIEKLREGFYSYHTEVSGGYFLIQKTFTEAEKCALQEIKDFFIQFSQPWVVMRRRTPYAELFKIGIKMLIERGFKSRFARRYYTEKPICSSKSSRFLSVGMLDCFYAFILLLVGYVIAIVIVLLEMGFNKYSKKRQLRNRAKHKDLAPEIEFFN